MPWRKSIKLREYLAFELELFGYTLLDVIGLCNCLLQRRRSMNSAQRFVRRNDTAAVLKQAQCLRDGVLAGREV